MLRGNPKQAIVTYDQGLAQLRQEVSAEKFISLYRGVMLNQSIMMASLLDDIPGAEVRIKQLLSKERSDEAAGSTLILQAMISFQQSQTPLALEQLQEAMGVLQHHQTNLHTISSLVTLSESICSQEPSKKSWALYTEALHLYSHRSAPTAELQQLLQDYLTLSADQHRTPAPVLRMRASELGLDLGIP